MKIKKLLSAAFLFLLIACSFSIAPNINAMQIPEGAVVKTADNPDVYIIKYKNGKQFKRLVLNPQVFKSYGHLKWENILIISQNEMDSFAVSDLIRVDGQTDIYQLIPNGDVGTKVLLTSTDGYDLDSAYTINDVDFNNYTVENTSIDSYYNPSTNTENYTIASVVKYWKPRVVYVECYFSNTTGSGYLKSSGSGLFMGNYSDDPNFLKVLTNAHVAGISNQRGVFAADFCKLKFPDDAEIITSTKISVGSGWLYGTNLDEDVAFITIEKPSQYLKKITSKTQFCTEIGNIGDELVVLGYPSIGSYEEVTATRGIISSYESYFYLTDAKIEHGNSGGIAILVNKNCNLGIPTAAIAGEIESLGRILDGGTALYWLAH